LAASCAELVIPCGADGASGRSSQHASSLAALATKFALHHPGVTTGITSMHIAEYARMNIAPVDEQPLPEDVAHRLL